MEDEIKSLINKASKADKSEDAMRFSQAANNAANAMITFHAYNKSVTPENK